MGVVRIGAALVVAAAVTASCSASAPAHRSSSAPTSSVPAPSTSSIPSSPTRPTTSAATHASTPMTRRATPTTAPLAPTPTHRPAAHSAARLPLAFTTGRASQVITVTAPSTGSTTGTLQAWRRVSGGWQRVGPAVHAYLGSDGLSRQPSESRSATPIGSFTLTQAFGHDPDPGTALPYTHTTPADWWISQPGPLYNTRQRCSSGCSFTRGDPNEHLYYETPYYDYAVVIDYNTRNAPGGVRQGAGSAFFLHVTVGAPTAGCVSIASDQLTRLLRWLTPSRHPRILIGPA